MRLHAGMNITSSERKFIPSLYVYTDMNKGDNKMTHKLPSDMNLWLAQLYRAGHDEHIESAKNHHIWALGSKTDEESTYYELLSDEHRTFANMCKNMARELEAEVEFPEEFDFVSHINPEVVIFHAKANGDTYTVTCEKGYHSWRFFKKEVHEHIFNGEYEIVKERKAK